MRVDAVTAEASRRKLWWRQTSVARRAADALVRVGVAPDAVSIIGLVVAGLAGVALWGAGRPVGPGSRAAFLLAAAAGIQLRLLCNLLDGMVALASDKASPYGEIFNDLPDRAADVFILVGAGYAARSPAGPTMGWVAAMLAVMTAYVRVLGRSCGTPMRFLGPMAKQHRMAAVTAACVLAAAAAPWEADGRVMGAALAVVIAGCVVTLARRLARLRDDLRGAGQ